MQLTVIVSRKSETRVGESKVIQIAKDVCVIGRIEGDITIDDAACSRQHAVLFENEEGELYLRDLNSTNGTKLNGHKVDGTSHKVLTGHFIQIGGVTLEILRFKPETKQTKKTAKTSVCKKAAQTTIKDKSVVIQWPEAIYCLPKNKQAEYEIFVDKPLTSKKS